MKEVYSSVTKIRRLIFKEVATVAFSGNYDKVDELPFKIIPGEVASYRDSVFKERAIVAERIRLACGLNLRHAHENAPISTDFNKAITTDRVFETPLINVIPFACNSCPENSYEVTSTCRGCLAHPCTDVCPVDAVSLVGRKSFIDQDKCIKCGKCAVACPYNAIIHYDRPCALACGVDAIEDDSLGRATINPDKCVSCGQCLVSCPFSAIADKSQIFQLILGLKSKEKVIASVAPAFVGQFGPDVTPAMVKSALLEIGFDDVYEVALGADAGAIEEAHHFIEKIPNEQRFLATSCCPSWSVMAKTWFPEIADCISDALTPMVATARIIKKEHPDAKVVFIGPCAAKKLEAYRKSVKSDVDFVITFEELMGIFAAKGLDFANQEPLPIEQAAATGRGYAVAGGVADAIVSCIKKINPEHDVPVDRAEGLRNCRKMLTIAKAGKRDGYLLEGMACEGGCIGGAGTLIPNRKAALEVKSFMEQSKFKNALDKID